MCVCMYTCIYIYIYIYIERERERERELQKITDVHKLFRMLTKNHVNIYGHHIGHIVHK